MAVKKTGRPGDRFETASGADPRHPLRLESPHPPGELDQLQAQLDALRLEIQHLHQIINYRTLEDRFAHVLLLKGARVAYRRIRGRLRYLGYALRTGSFKVFPLEDSPQFRPYEVVLHQAPLADRPRVLHLIANFVTGGSARLVVDLIEHLGHRFDQQVITAKLPAPPHYVGLDIAQRARFHSAADALTQIEAKRPDLVHVHYVADPDAEYSAWDWNWYHMLFLALENYVARHPCRVVENLNIPVPPYISPCVDRYVYVSDYVRKRFELHGAPVLTIYPGSNLDRFRRASGRPVPDDTIGMVYRLQPDKLDERSVEPFIRTVQRREGTRALIVGGGYYLEAYKAAVERAGVMKAFTFTGYVAYGDLPSLLAQMSVFVAPVHRESFGQVSPFAMGMGIPVTGYDVGALAEITGDETLLAPAGDSESLAGLIVDLLDDRERRLRIGERNRQRARERFSVEAMTRSYEALYDDLLPSTAPRR